MSSGDQFCLRWNDFGSNIGVAFREIREEKDFFDCTLSVGDRQLQAHKLILSACSPFFRSVLKKNPHQHPLLYLKDVEFSDLQAVVNFMYHGEVNVAQEDLNSFLAVAEDLKVKGLAQDTTKRSSNSVQKPSSKLRDALQKTNGVPSTRDDLKLKDVLSVPHIAPSDPPPPKKSKPCPELTSECQNGNEEDIQEVMPVVKTELGGDQPSMTTFLQSVVQAQGQMEDQTGYGVEDGYDYEINGDCFEGLEGASLSDTNSGVMIDDAIEVVDLNQFRCLICGIDFTKRHNCARHIKTIHYGMMRRDNVKRF